MYSENGYNGSYMIKVMEGDTKDADVIYSLEFKWGCVSGYTCFFDKSNLLEDFPS